MMKCVSVCLSRKIITSHFRAEHQRCKVSGPLGLPAVGLLWPSDHYDDYDKDNNDDDHDDAGSGQRHGKAGRGGGHGGAQFVLLHPI